MQPNRIFSRHRIDASVSDALFALGASVFARGRPGGAINGAVVCLSVRSALDLLLQCVDWKPGDEVIMSAVTHPDMARIVELHGFVVVPVDIDIQSLAPTEEAIRRAITPKTRAIMIAHLFGSSVDLDHIVKMAKLHDLLFIEDCAQALNSPGDSGDPRADISLYSFGFIKTATALGGALVWVRNSQLRSAMHWKQNRWPVQSRQEYAMKSLKCLAAILLTQPRPYRFLLQTGRNLSEMARTVPPGDDAAFLRWLRRRPSAGLVAMLKRRLERFPTKRLRERTAAGEEIAARLPYALIHPGRAATGATHWLFPIVSKYPQRVVDTLLAAGFEATEGTSQIRALTPEGSLASEMMKGIVFVPAYPEIPASERTRLIAILRGLESSAT